MPAFAIKDIQANPFRHIGRYPIRRDKVAALRESIKTTGFWDNIVARKRDGKAQIAYGHHRLVALKEEFGPNHKVELITRDLDDGAMLQIMARENLEEWGTSASVEQETIRAVVEAYAKGQVQLPKVGSETSRASIRYAPSFAAGEDVDPGRRQHPYTADTLARFIGWIEPSGRPQGKVLSALTAVQFIDEGLLHEKDFEGLTTKQAEAVIDEARKARSRREAEARVHRMQAEQAEREAQAAQKRREEAERDRRRLELEAADARNAEARRKAVEEAKRQAQQQREAEEARRHAAARGTAERHRERASMEEGRRKATTVGRAVSESLKAGKIGYRQAVDVAIKAEGKREGAPRYIEEYAKRVTSDLNAILDPDRDQRVKRLLELVKYRDSLDPSVRADLGRTLVVVGNRAFDYARQFGIDTSGKVSPLALPAKTRS